MSNLTSAVNHDRERTPRGHVWHLPVDHPYRLGRRAGRFCFVGGAADLNAEGKIDNAGDLLGQVPGAIESTSAALRAQNCDLNDVVRLKAFFRPGSGDGGGWALLAALRRHFSESPAPVISMQPSPMMPWNGQELQLQAIAVKGWRKQAPVHFVAEPLPRPVMPDAAEYTLGLLAGGFFAASDMPGFRGGFEGGSLAAETSFVMDRLKTIMDGLDVCYNDVIKVEGYYPYVNPDDWLPPAKERFRRFPEGAAVATGLPWPIPWPSNVRTKIELLGYRTQLGDYSKRVPRADSWPDWVWDWPVRNNFRQGLLVDDCVWLGGQIPFGAGRGNIQSPGDLSRQVDCTMAVISDILGGFNKRLDDLALLVCYYESDGSEESTRRFLDRLAMNIPGPLPPITLVPEPMVHTKRTTNEIWGVACA